MTNSATMLQFDWEAVEGATVLAIVAKRARALNDGSLECQQIALVVGDQAVVLRVTNDTDELVVSLEAFTNQDGEWEELGQLADVVSRRLGWCWVGRNYRGYLDNFSFGVDGIEPQYTFIGCGSAIQCARTTPIRA